MKEDLLLIATALTLLVIVFQAIKGFLLSKRHWHHRRNIAPELTTFLEQAKETPRDTLRELDAKALDQTERVRASYYSTAGEIALTYLRRPNVAIRYYSRALRIDPRCTEALDRMLEIVSAQKKMRRLEHICWTLLARLDDSDVGTAIWKKCWGGLITVYASSPRLTNRADAIRKMLKACEDEDAELTELVNADTQP